MKLVFVVLSVLTVSVGLLAQLVDFGATGTFRSKDLTFEVASAIAFTATSPTVNSEPKLLVAISDAVMIAQGLADFMDRRLAVEKLVKGSVTPVAYLEFTPAGVYRGLSYRFGPTYGCDSCASGLRSTVKLANGRLTGTLTGTDNDLGMDVRLDVRVMSDDHGPALPAGGGEPGKVYSAYDAALVARDVAALKATVVSSQVAAWESAPAGPPPDLEYVEMPGDAKSQLEFLRSSHPIRSVRITKGWATANKALLLFEGESAKGPVAGEVLLFKEGARWLVDTEIVQMLTPQ